METSFEMSTRGMARMYIKYLDARQAGIPDRPTNHGAWRQVPLWEGITRHTDPEDDEGICPLSMVHGG